MFMPTRHLLVACIVVLTLATWRQPASAQLQLESREAIALQNQILELRRELQAVQDQGRGGSPTYLGRGGPPAPTAGSDLLAQLLTWVGVLEEQVRQLRGRVDETQNLVQQQGAQLGKRIRRSGLPDAAPAWRGPTREYGAGSADRPTRATPEPCRPQPAAQCAWYSPQSACRRRRPVHRPRRCVGRRKSRCRRATPR